VTGHDTPGDFDVTAREERIVIGKGGEMYGWKVGDVAELKVRAVPQQSNDNTPVEAGELVRIISITPKTYINRELAAKNPDQYDTKQYFYNAVPVTNKKGDDHSRRIREHFITIKKPSKAKGGLVDFVNPILKEGGDSKHIKEIIGDKKEVASVALMVGPEGGFTEPELDEAIRAGYVPVMLGQRILRTETAAISALTILQYELGDFG